MNTEPKPIVTGLLTWTRTQDGFHNERPIYEYAATLDNVKYSVVWSNAGFGLSAYDTVSQTYVMPRAPGANISWLRARSRCFEAAEKVARSRGV